ncbi:zinc finger protein ZFP2-like [Euwallacea similis]|uniref:zinc finger protein ZFP2-like n=1 Tax=Euwallacea similis TaxID=1736056 RepID=UPI003450062B
MGIIINPPGKFKSPAMGTVAAARCCPSGLKGYGSRGPRASQGIRPESDLSPICNVETSPHTPAARGTTNVSRAAVRVVNDLCVNFHREVKCCEGRLGRITSEKKSWEIMEASGSVPVVNDAWRSYATICRLCLQKDGFMLGIFNNIQGKEKSISKKIVDCTALSVRQGDGLPNVICHRCLFKIEFCLEFRQLCFISDATLRQLSGFAKEIAPEENITGPQMPFYDQMLNGGDDNVVMVVDPNALDYESDADSDERHSDIETNDLEINKNVSMCKFCDHAFTDTVECAEHESTAHNSDCPYSCSSCAMNFADRLVYSAHMKSVHKNDKPYNCPQCDRTFARRSDLRKHTIVHTGVKPYTCSVCTKSFSRNTNLSKHMRIHSGTKPFVCSKCPRTFTSRGDLNRHSMIHTGQRPFRCNYCHLSFGRKDKLFRHEQRHWPEENSKDKSEELQVLRQDLGIEDYTYKTGIGDGFEKLPRRGESRENMVINLDPFSHTEFGSETNLQRGHVSDDVLDQSALPSVSADLKEEFKTEDAVAFTDTSRDQITGESFSSDGPNRSVTDSETKRYNCLICTKQFSTPDNLKYHMARHTGHRPFACHVCGKSFIRKRELDRHVVTHTGLKPFKCTKCFKSFGRKDKLVRHLRIHDRRDVPKKFSADKIRKPLFLQQRLMMKNKMEGKVD